MHILKKLVPLRAQVTRSVGVWSLDLLKITNYRTLPALCFTDMETVKQKKNNNILIRWPYGGEGPRTQARKGPLLVILDKFLQKPCRVSTERPAHNWIIPTASRSKPDGNDINIGSRRKEHTHYSWWVLLDLIPSTVCLLLSTPASHSFTRGTKSWKGLDNEAIKSSLESVEVGTDVRFSHRACGVSPPPRVRITCRPLTASRLCEKLLRYVHSSSVRQGKTKQRLSHCHGADSCQASLHCNQQPPVPQLKKILPPKYTQLYVTLINLI